MVNPQAVQLARQRAGQLNQARVRKNIKQSVPPPIGGWNTRDNIGNMPPTDAFELTNMVPDVGGVNLLRGYESWSTGMTGQIQAVMGFDDKSVEDLVVSDSTGTLYRATETGAATSLFDPTTDALNPPSGNGDYSFQMFNDRLIMTNGRFVPMAGRRSDDSASQIDTVDLLELTHSTVDPKSLEGVFAFKDRLFFWQRDSQDFLYLPIEQFQGALTLFPLSRVAQKGGRLVAMTSWTLDGGDGPDDLACFIMSSGEVLVYAGNDPARSSAWALVNRYKIGRPINRHAVEQFGGQVLVATDIDYVTLPGAFVKAGFQDPTKLSGAAKENVSKHKTKDGWQVIFSPSAGWLFVNAPQGGNTFHQHVINLRTGAAFKIEGWPARVFGESAGQLYFGDTSGTVYRALTTKSNAGANIDASIKQAFSDLSSQDDKRIDYYRVMMTADGTIAPQTGVMYDFEAIPKTRQSITLSNNLGADWGDDWGTDWATPSKARFEWQSGDGKGTSVAMELQLSTKDQDVTWFRTDYVGHKAGNL